MNTTRVSLLERVQSTADAEAWHRLVHLYQPLLRHWLSRSGLQPSDVDDLVQDVLTVVLRKLPEFCHDGRSGSFRSWLRAIVVYRLRDFWRARKARPMATGGSDYLQTVEQLEDPDSQLSRLWNAEHDQQVLRQLTAMIEAEFKPTTWQAFRSHVIEGIAADEVAHTLGLSINAVLIAKSRVLQRLREEGRGLLDEDQTIP
jgi:RNA polymerase sigma-70 factor (ECF subfamily)